jgi:multidrug efflux pump subunit AcrB
VIALGVVVDDAIIGVQNILRRLREHREGGDPRSTMESCCRPLEVRGRPSTRR